MENNFDKFRQILKIEYDKEAREIPFNDLWAIIEIEVNNQQAQTSSTRAKMETVEQILSRTPDLK